MGARGRHSSSKPGPAGWPGVWFSLLIQGRLGYESSPSRSAAIHRGEAGMTGIAAGPRAHDRPGVAQTDTRRAISVFELSYFYGDIKAVNGISFDVAQGEILGFLGPNGAGKSTTIRMLTGQLTPLAGHAYILGTPVTKESPEIQARIGVCFEEKNLYVNMTGEENLRFFARLHGIKAVSYTHLRAH